MWKRLPAARPVVDEPGQIMRFEELGSRGRAYLDHLGNFGLVAVHDIALGAVQVAEGLHVLGIFRAGSHLLV